MQTMIDILGAMMVGAILLLIALSAMDQGVQRFVNHNADAIVQNELANMSQIIQADLRKMGYGVPESDQDDILQVAASNRLRFLADLNSDSAVDTIEIGISVTDTIRFIDTTVSLFRIQRRVAIAGQTPRAGIIGSTADQNMFKYLDQIGREVGYLPSVRMVEVTLVAMNPNIYLSDQVLVAETPEERMRELRRLIREAYWRQTRVISRNLRR